MHFAKIKYNTLNKVCFDNTDKPQTSTVSMGLFRLNASASKRRRKTRRAGFGTRVYQSEHSHRTRCVIIFIQ